MAKAVYIHIPFCRNICSYCDFCKFLYNEKWAYAYLKTLKEEVEDRYLDDPVSSIYIGGGTPSCLSKEDLRNLFSIIQLFKKIDDCEFTFECNIEDITIELLVILKYYGVNRLSIGIQSFNPQNLEFMERNVTYKEAEEKIKLCRENGFNNINLDLMYAIPNETMKDLEKDLDLFLDLKPEHISAYSLMIEKNTKIAVEEKTAIDEELDYNMFKKIEKKLKKYNHYEISNYALEGYESKHNLTYWQNKEYYGFGLGASGYIDGIRYENTKNLKKYLLKDYVHENSILNKFDKMKDEIMLGLRLLKGINKEEFKLKYDIDIYEAFDIKPLIISKDLIDKDGFIFINPIKLYVMNEILIKII